MLSYFVSDIDDCMKLWERLIPVKDISDLWDFRLCFQRHFNHRPFFLILEDGSGIAGMLPLSYVKELDMFAFFPGEIWKGKTWIERTPVYLREPDYVEELLSHCPERTYLRYMEPFTEFYDPGFELDEIGYVLYPPDFDFDLDQFLKRFSRKRIREIKKVIRSFSDDSGTFHVNRLVDFGLLLEMSLQYFGRNSYLYDPRFREGFRDVMYFLYDNGFLRMVSFEIHGRIAAVDLGALFNGTYTVFLGGTNSQFPGIAKAMNMHHIEYACNQKATKLDFLCGDFHWKRLWHLDPEPLYRFVTPELRSEEELEGVVKDDPIHQLDQGHRHS
jgi:hypothetical protein